MSETFEIFCELITNLRGDNRRMRSEAMDAIAKIADPSCTNLLLDALKAEQDPRVRASLLKVLGRIGSSRIMDYILEFLLSPDPRMRSNAVESLGELGKSNTEVLASLRGMLDDADNRVVGTTIRVLYDLGDETGIQCLRELLRGDDNSRRCSAIWAVGAMRYHPELDTVIRYLGSPVYRVHSIASRAIQMFGADAVEPLLKSLEGARSPHRVFIIIALGRLGDRRAVPSLLRALHDGEFSVRSWVIEALARCHGTQALGAIRGDLDSKDSDLRIEVLKALKTLQSSEDVERIFEHLDHESDPRVIAAGIATLGEIGSTEHAPRLEPYTAHHDVRVRANSIEALGLLGDRAILEQLFGHLEDTEGRVVANTAIAIAGLQQKGVLEILQARLRTGDERLRLSVAYALGEISLEGVIRPLVDAIFDESMRVRRMALAGLLKHKDRFRSELIDRLETTPMGLNEVELVKLVGELELSGSLEQLVGILRDAPSPLPETADAQELLESLRSAIDQGSVPIPNLISDEDPRTARRLRDLLGHDDPHVRCFALEALGALGRKDYVGSVVCLLADTDPAVRRYALACLERIGDRRALVFLIDRLGEEDLGVKDKLLDVFARIGDAEALATLKESQEQIPHSLRAKYESTMVQISQRIELGVP